MLKVKNITKYYGDILAVDDLSFTVGKGEVFGLLGVNGAGKTTTFRMILGLLDKNNGEITLNDKPIDYTVTDRIGFLSEDRSLLVKLTVKEQAIFYGTLKGISEEEILKRLDKLLKRFEISEYLNRKIKELSKGNQQKIQFIMAIINQPKLLILDEPFTGLDPINIEMFMAVIRELKEEGCIIIFSSHRMEHVEMFCESVVILVKGKSVLSGKLKDIKAAYRNKTIIINGDVNIKDLKEIDGVVEVKKVGADINVKIKDDTFVSKVFKLVGKSKNINKFVVEEPSLNEIFVSKVGEAYEK